MGQTHGATAQACLPPGHEAAVPAAQVARIERLYDSIALQGVSFHEAQTPLTRGVRGRQKRRPRHNLADSLAGLQRRCVAFPVPRQRSLHEQSG